ncbi:MAG: hypothetical protein ACE5JJ_03095 [Nitrospinota bacterium]
MTAEARPARLSDTLRLREYWAWHAHRFAGVLLILFLGAHFLYLHYFIAWPLRFEDLVRNPVLRVIDIGALALAIYHGLYGLRKACVDLGVGERGRRTLTPLFVLFGLASFAYGLWVFGIFLG